MNTKNNKILPVNRTKDQAKKSYDRISKYYDWIAGVFEKKNRNRALKLLDVAENEIVLEIGFGTGHALKKMSESVGDKGKVYGIDISSEMLKRSEHRLEKAGMAGRVELTAGNALSMPYEDNKFDAAFMSFTLELFDTSEIPKVLEEIKRVLKAGGRLGVVSLTKEYDHSRFIKIYEWMHKKFPRYADCRPIYVEHSLQEAGLRINLKKRVSLFGLPVGIIVCENSP